MAISDADKARLNGFKGIFKRIGLGDIIQGYQNDLATMIEAATAQAVAILDLQNEEVSDETTGDGTEQSIAHTIGAVPSVVLVIPSDVGADGATFAVGTVTDEVIPVTATTGAKYRVYARK